MWAYRLCIVQYTPRSDRRLGYLLNIKQSIIQYKTYNIHIYEVSTVSIMMLVMSNLTIRECFESAYIVQGCQKVGLDGVISCLSAKGIDT